MRLCIRTCRSRSSLAARCFFAWRYSGCTCGAIFAGLRTGSGDEDPVHPVVCPLPLGFSQVLILKIVSEGYIPSYSEAGDAYDGATRIGPSCLGRGLVADVCERAAGLALL